MPAKDGLYPSGGMKFLKEPEKIRSVDVSRRSRKEKSIRTSFTCLSTYHIDPIESRAPLKGRSSCRGWKGCPGVNLLSFPRRLAATVIPISLLVIRRGVRRIGGVFLHNLDILGGPGTADPLSTTAVWLAGFSPNGFDCSTLLLCKETHDDRDSFNSTIRYQCRFFDDSGCLAFAFFCKLQRIGKSLSKMPSRWYSFLVAADRGVILGFVGSLSKFLTGWTSVEYTYILNNKR